MIEIVIFIIKSVITAYSAITIAKLKYANSEKFNLKLLKRLNLALDNNTSKNDNQTNKLEVCMIFEMLTKLKLSYQDIIKLIKDDNAGLIIYFLKKTPNYVEYKNGVLNYNKDYNDLLLKIERPFRKIQEYIFLILFIVATIIFIFSSSIEEKIIMGIQILILGYGWIDAMRINNYSKKIQEIIDIQGTVQNSVSASNSS